MLHHWKIAHVCSSHLRVSFPQALSDVSSASLSSPWLHGCRWVPAGLGLRHLGNLRCSLHGSVSGGHGQLCPSPRAAIYAPQDGWAQRCVHSSWSRWFLVSSTEWPHHPPSNTRSCEVRTSRNHYATHVTFPFLCFTLWTLLGLGKHPKLALVEVRNSLLFIVKLESVPK